MINRKAFIVGIKSTSLSKKEIIFLKKHKPWGVILFSRNVKGFEQIKKLIKDIRFIFKDKNYPILIDQEGGRVSRLDKIINLRIFSLFFWSTFFGNDEYERCPIILLDFVALTSRTGTVLMLTAISFNK